MSAVSKLAWHVECDAPDCSVSSLDADEPYVQDTAEEAVKWAEGDGWTRLDDGSIACPDHLLDETSTGWTLRTPPASEVDRG